MRLAFFRKSRGWARGGHTLWNFFTPRHNPRSMSLALAAEISELCPVTAPFFGFMGIASALVFGSESPPERSLSDRARARAPRFARAPLAGRSHLSCPAHGACAPAQTSVPPMARPRAASASAPWVSTALPSSCATSSPLSWLVSSVFTASSSPSSSPATVRPAGGRTTEGSGPVPPSPCGPRPGPRLTVPLPSPS